MDERVCVYADLGAVSSDTFLADVYDAVETAVGETFVLMADSFRRFRRTERFRAILEEKAGAKVGGS